MAGLRPGAVLPKDMDARQFPKWCREQISTDPADVAAQLAIHTASTDNTTLAELVAAILAHTNSTDNTTAAELANALLPYLLTADLLTEILAVDGAGSGIDADLLDAQSGAFYLARGNHTGSQSITTLSDLPALASGVYTPTLTNVANLDGSTAHECQYLRVGSVVHVSGRVGADPTAGGAVQLGISLPVASNLGALEDCAGTGFAPAISEGAAIVGDAANNRAEMQWVAVDTADQVRYFSFAYQII